MKTKLDANSTNVRRPRQRFRRAIFWAAIVVLPCLLWFLHTAWQQTTRREAYLPQLEAQAQQSPFDGALQALLGARLIEAHEYQIGIEALQRSIAGGEHREPVWQSLAAALAVRGEGARALAVLKLGQQTLGTAPDLEASLQRARSLSRPTPATMAQAISPAGVAPLTMSYEYGSFLNGAASWWGRRHPEDSGFATRRLWAQQEPQNIEAQRLWGLALLTNRRVSESISVLAHTITLDANSAPSHLAFAQALEQGGLTTKANTEYIDALKLRPDWLPALLGLGRTSLRAGLEWSAAAFRRATKIDPNSVEAWIGLGRALSEDTVNLSEALRAFQTATRLAPSRTDFDTDHAATLLRENRAPEAETLLRRRLAASPNDVAAHYLLSGLLLQHNPTNERLAEAEAQSRQALLLSPGAAQGRGQLGEVLLRRGKTSEAIGVLQSIIDQNPYEIKARRILARAYGRNGQAAKAEQVTARERKLFAAVQQANALEIQRDARLLDPQFHRQLLRLYQQTGQPAKVAQQQQLLQQLQQDPQGLARRYRDYQAAMKKLLGDNKS